MSLLFKRHFQLAYLVDDVDQGMAEFREKYGIAQWHVMDMAALHGAEGPIRYIALAWTDEGLMVELIEPNEDMDSIYRNWRKDSGQSARFHHLGFLVDSDEEFAAIKAQLVAAGSPIAAEGEAGEMLQFAYIDTTRAFGHYYELIHLRGAGKTQFFAAVPHN